MHRITILSQRARLSQRGSILLLVLALLSVLVLLATTLIYVSKIEGAAANNAGKMVQNRMSLLTGVPMAISAMAQRSGTPLAMNQAWVSLDFSAAGTTSNLSTTPTQTPTPTGEATPAVSTIAVETPQDGTSNKISAAAATLAQTAVSDQSALLNLNTVNFPDNSAVKTVDPRLISTKTFRQFVNARLQAAGLPKDKNSKLGRCHSNWQCLGSDRSPGRAVRKAADAASSTDVPPATDSATSSKAEFEMDIRQKPNGDDTPYRTVEDLLKVPGMSLETCQAIAPYITTFSSSLDVWTDEKGDCYPRLPINTASLDDIAVLLKNLYPSMDLEVIQQFAVNIVDRRDTDSIPTVFVGGIGVDPIIGCEFNPVISEICPDVITLAEDDDNGEYIELYNPLSTAVNVQGWRIDWGAGMTMLSGVIAPQGYLILTDNIKKDDDANPRDDAIGMGSFVDVFGIFPSTGQKRILEVQGMEIPDTGGQIHLYDASGQMIDFLNYRNSLFNGSNRGFQKHYLFGHVGFPGPADPYKDDLESPSDDYSVACFQLYYERMNQSFKSEVEVLAVPCGYATGLEATEAIWPFPSLASNRSDTLDSRMIDCFTAADKATAPLLVNGMLQKIETSATPAPDAGLIAGDSTSEIHVVKKPADSLVFGKINVNSAPLEVLEVLPGVTKDIAARIVNLRRTGTTSASNAQSNQAAFGSLSGFAANAKIWEGVKPYDRLTALADLVPVLTVNSTSYKIVSTGVDPTVTDPARVNRQSCQSLVCLNGSGASIIDWNFVFIPAQASSDAGTTASPESKTMETAKSKGMALTLKEGVGAKAGKSVK